MMKSQNAVGAIALALCLTQTANGQDQPASSAPAPTSPAPADSGQSAETWTDLPFSSLANFARLIPIGMPRNALVETLGRPAMVMPGRGSDEVYMYEYAVQDGSAITATVVVRDRKVFIRRLYVRSPSG